MSEDTPCLKRIEDKVNVIDKRLDRIDITLAENTQALKDHIRRTEILEEKVKPLETDHAHRQGAMKLVRWIGWIAGTILSLYGVYRLIY